MSDQNLVPKIREQNPGQREFALPGVYNPYNGVWWTTQTVTDVPENVMGWLVAQGFEVTNIRQDTTTNPPTNYFSVRKDGIQPRQLLNSMCNSYVIAANDARAANDVRYSDIVRSWTEMIDTSHEQFDAQVDEQNYQSGVYLADLDQYMNTIDAMISDNQSQVIMDYEAAKVALDEMLVRLADLETNATNNASDIEVLFAEQDTNLANFVNSYNAKLLELDQNFLAYLGDILAQINALGGVIDGHIADYNQQFVILANNYTDHAADIDSQLASVQANVDTYVAAVAQILALLEADYTEVEVDLTAIKDASGNLVTQYAGDYDAILSRLESDYSSHATTARGFLTNLGQTELARINEQFSASLSAQLQMLVSKGLSMSTIPVDITARNQRDKDENIQTLNDRLNREKLENQHKLYEQQASMRARTLEGTDRMHSVQQEVLRYQASLVSSMYSLLSETRNRILAGKQAIFAANDANAKYGIEISSNLYAKLQEVRQRTIDSVDRIYQIRDVFAKWKAGETVKQYEQLQQIEAQFLEAIRQQHTARQEITKIEISERDTLLGQLQNSLNALMSGKERYAVLLMQNANTLAEHKHKAILEMMNTSVKRLDGWSSIADEERKLMAYQLDERNKLLVGLYSFVERREDVGPEWKDAAQMIAGLGDSAGGWLTPN